MKNKYELISIIVPVYNVAPFLKACINSILRQTYTNIEIILVNDGSKDESGRLCDEYITVDNRIRVIHKANGGLSDARNVGIKNSSGEYLVFIDSDDLVAPTYVEHLKCLIDEYQADIGICDPIHCYTYDNVQYTETDIIKKYTSEEAIEEMLYQTSFLFTAWGKIFPKAYFIDTLFPVGMLFEDVAVMYRIFDKASNIIYSNAKLYAYMHREGSITTECFSKKDLDILAICKQIREYFYLKSVELVEAARVYSVVGALRVYNNAPKTEEYLTTIAECKDYILSNYRDVIKNKKIRKKMRYALYLFKYMRPLMKVIYKRVDRWK